MKVNEEPLGVFLPVVWQVSPQSHFYIYFGSDGDDDEQHSSSSLSPTPNTHSDYNILSVWINNNNKTDFMSKTNHVL